jgi:hypothetical protein
VCSRVDDSKHHFGFADDFAVDETATAGFDDGFFPLGHFDFDEEGIAWDHGFAEFDGIGAHEVANFSRVTWEAEEEDAPDLSHGFHLEDAWHDGMTGEVAWKVPFVHGDGFHADAFGFAFDGDDPIDHEEGVAVGEKFHDIIDVEDIAAFGGDAWGEEGEGFGELFSGARWSALAVAGARVQRPLWASTGTKNPKYSDVLYIDTLIGPDTVNTVPPATLTAILDHGVAARTIDLNVAQAYKTLAQLMQLGLNIHVVAEALQTEGVASFSKSFETLMAALSEKRQRLLAANH